MAYPELYILRHGQTEWNAQNRMQGALNSPLTAKGEQDAAKQGAILANRDLTGFQFWCSPQGRAVQTAGIALARLAADIHTDARLREIGVGDWSGLLRDTLPLPDGPDPYALQYDMAPNGEGFAALEIRARAFLDDLTGPSVLVTHGITSRVLRTLIVGPSATAQVTDHGGQGCVYHLKDGQQILLT
jgi:broad specificity phosphatase PhoE